MKRNCIVGAIILPAFFIPLEVTVVILPHPQFSNRPLIGSQL